MLQRRDVIFFFVALVAPSLCSAQVTMCTPPSITVGPPQYVLSIAAANIPLPCQASGTNPNYHWEFNGTVIQCPSPGFTCVNGVPTNITSAQASNEGFYRCFVTGTCGSTMSTLSQLQLQTLGAPSTVVSTPQYSVNTPFSLPCGSQSTPSIADKAMRSPSSPYGGIPAITWYTVTSTSDQDLKQVQLSGRIQINSITGDLYFGTPLLTDAGSNILYKCGTRLSNGETYGGFSEPGLSGPESNFAAAPFFKSLVPPQGLEGQSVEMQCFFSGRPTPSMQASSWTRSGGVSLPQGRTTYANSFTKLIIANVVPEDAGDYICAPSGMPTLTQTINLVVDAVPVFKSVTDEPHDIKATEGDTVTVNCNAYARPVATVQWYQNTTAFDATSLPSNKFVLSSNKTELTITNVCKGSASCGGGYDLMALQCDATNIHGKAFAQGSLDVLFPTIINSTAIEEPVPNSALVIFPCEAYTDPTTNLTRTWYYKDNTIAQNDLIYVDSAGALHIDMRNDADGGYARCGVYRCEATNGYSEYNIYSNLTCDPPVAAASLWWISLIVVGFLLLLLILLLCCFFFYCYSGNEGDTYPVDKKERENGNDPVRDLRDNDFKDYQRDGTTGQAAYVTPASGVSTMTTAYAGDDYGYRTGGATFSTFANAGTIDPLPPYQPQDFAAQQRNSATLYDPNGPGQVNYALQPINDERRSVGGSAASLNRVSLAFTPTLRVPPPPPNQPQYGDNLNPNGYAFDANADRYDNQNGYDQHGFDYNQDGGGHVNQGMQYGGEEQSPRAFVDPYTGAGRYDTGRAGYDDDRYDNGTPPANQLARWGPMNPEDNMLSEV